jgi:TolA-binding protein
MMLEKSQRDNISAGSQVDDLRDQIQEVKNERDQLSREFETLMRQPFFQKETEKNNFQKIDSLQSEVNKLESELKKSRVNIIK